MSRVVFPAAGVTLNAMTRLAPITRVLRSMWNPSTRGRAREQEMVHEVLDASARLSALGDDALESRSRSLRDQIQQGTDPACDAAIISGFSLVCEAARRSLGVEYYGVQILAGLALTRGKIAEMATGEGKTLVAAFPAFMHALRGKGVHVLTVNRYLAERDCHLMSPIFQRLGVTVGLLRQGDTPAGKRAAYGCDVTYGPGYEFGFDYLRDQLALINQPKLRLGEAFHELMHGRDSAARPLIQRGQAFAVVDEADSVMIDEATTPLVLSGSDSEPAQNPKPYRAAHQLAAELNRDSDYVEDDTTRKVRLTEVGAERARVCAASVRRDIVRPWPQYVEQALFAKLFLTRDVDYIVCDGRVVLVDEFTGRIFSDRTLRDGLHQAVEAKEGLTISSETQPLARIARQRYFRLYQGICGMTGTAIGCERELRECYRVRVTRIPTRLPCQRVMWPTKYFVSSGRKWQAVVDEIIQVHHTGRPVLVGTRTIDASEQLMGRLQEHRIAARLLNGRQDLDEAQVIARAGEAGSITIATNMAGRGTDIKLGPGVAELGGLHVVGMERHESARVDRQLAGRCARQGDPGTCRFFVSAEDDLIVRHGPALSELMGELADSAGDISIDLSRHVAQIQRQAECCAVARRQLVARHDHWQERVLARLASEEPL